MFYDFHKIYPGIIYEVGYDQYWGVDFIRYPSNVSERLQEHGAPKIVTSRRQVFLKYHRTPATLFVFAFLLYAYLIWQSYENSKPKKSLDPDAPSSKPDTATESTELTKLKKTQSLFDQ
jgi:hypothetical protein